MLNEQCCAFLAMDTQHTYFRENTFDAQASKMTSLYVRHSDCGAAAIFYSTFILLYYIAFVK